MVIHIYWLKQNWHFKINIVYQIRCKQVGELWGKKKSNPKTQNPAPLDGHKQILKVLRGKANIINAMLTKLITSNTWWIFHLQIWNNNKLTEIHSKCHMKDEYQELEQSYKVGIVTVVEYSALHRPDPNQFTLLPETQLQIQNYGKPCTTI